ncbi:MAG: hypothetical protein ACJ741_07390 [Pyrinomonadaceae bacterium]
MRTEAHTRDAPVFECPITKLLVGDLRFTEFFAGGQAPKFISAPVVAGAPHRAEPRACLHRFGAARERRVFTARKLIFRDSAAARPTCQL